MATRLTETLTYAATPEAVAAMLVDPAFREEVCAAQRVVRSTVAVSGREVRIEQAQSAERIPAFAQKLVGAEIEIHQVEQWHSPDAADVTITIPGKPGGARGTVRLLADGQGTREEVALEIKVGVPLVGGRLEDLIAGVLRKALAKEHQVGHAWLTRGGPA